MLFFAGKFPGTDFVKRSYTYAQVQCNSKIPTGNCTVSVVLEALHPFSELTLEIVDHLLLLSFFFNVSL